MSDETLFDGQEKEVAVTAELVKIADEQEKKNKEEGIISLSKAEGKMKVSLSTIIAEAEAEVDARKKVMGIVLKSTNEKDWSNQGGKPFLEASGCEKVAPYFHAKVKDITYGIERGKDEHGEWYRYIYTGHAVIERYGEIIHEIPNVIGTCSSRDKFFGLKDKKFKSLSEIDPSNIQKKARTNLYGNGIRKLLGLNNLTWDEVRVAGIDKDKVRSVDFGSSGEQSQDEKSLKDKLAEQLNKWMKLNNMDANADNKREVLKKFSMFKDKDGNEKFVTDITKLSEKWAQTTYGNVCKAIEAFEEMMDGEGKI